VWARLLALGRRWRELVVGSVGVRAPVRRDETLFSELRGGRLTIEREVLGSVGVRAPLRSDGVVLFSELIGGRLMVVNRGGRIDEALLLILPVRDRFEGRVMVEEGG